MLLSLLCIYPLKKVTWYFPWIMPSSFSIICKPFSLIFILLSSSTMSHSRFWAIENHHPTTKSFGWLSISAFLYMCFSSFLVLSNVLSTTTLAKVKCIIFRTLVLNSKWNRVRDVNYFGSFGSILYKTWK